MIPRTALFAYFWLCAALFCFGGPLLAEEKPDTAAPAETRMTVTYLYKSNDTVTLTAGVMVKHESGPTYLANAVIGFYAAGGAEPIKLGSVTTDETGTAVFRYGIKNGLPADKDGMTTYTISFTGTGKYPPAETTLAAKLASIRVSFEEVDSVRNIQVAAAEVVAGGEGKPLQQLTVNLYVQRLFSLLKIGEIALDDEGRGVLEFPHHLVGDSLGSVKIFARIDENDLYATVQGESNTDWGIKKHFFTAERPSRELWTPIAPMWMIITLIIMLAGVWAHYFYAVYQLFMIKYNSKEKNL